MAVPRSQLVSQQLKLCPPRQAAPQTLSARHSSAQRPLPPAPALCSPPPCGLRARLAAQSRAPSRCPWSCSSGTAGRESAGRRCGTETPSLLPGRATPWRQWQRSRRRGGVGRRRGRNAEAGYPSPKAKSQLRTHHAEPPRSMSAGVASRLQMSSRSCGVVPRAHSRAVTRCCATVRLARHTPLHCACYEPHSCVAQGSEGGSRSDRLVREVPVAAIRRPLAKSRANDPAKVAWLMKSIAEVRVVCCVD